MSIINNCCILISLLILINGSTGRVSFDFEDMDVRTIIETIATQAQVNIVCGEDVKGRVTMRVHHMEWIEALDLVVRVTGLGYERFDNIVYIDTPDNLAGTKIGELSFIAYEIRDVNLAGVTDKVRGLLSSKGTILSDERTSQIIIHDYKDVHEKVSALIAELDRPTRQVMIEVSVADVMRVANDAVELEWDLEDILLPLQRIIATNLQIGTEQGVVGYLNMRVGTVSRSDFNVLIKMISARAKDITMRTGKLLVQDHYEGSMTIGDRFSVLLRDISGNTTVQMFNSGFEIAVTPHITSDNHVTLDVMIELSDLDKASALMGTPIMSTFKTEITLHLAHAETAIMVTQNGGDKGRNVQRPLPVNVPLIDYLFSPWSRSEEEMYQYIMITPYISE